ncbi:VF530 family protein [Puniceicoccaceae bacterium K14]|nr:VF530 family protein [Puniceicoccaceae bacterium K14]
MSDQRHNDPLHGLSLKAILTDLVERYGWEELAQSIKINCFATNPSIKSSLTFLRKTPWAREKVENFYLWSYGKKIPERPRYDEPPPKTAKQSERSYEKPKEGVNPWTGKPYEN